MRSVNIPKSDLCTLSEQYRTAVMQTWQQQWQLKPPLPKVQAPCSHGASSSGPCTFLVGCNRSSTGSFYRTRLQHLKMTLELFVARELCSQGQTKHICGIRARAVPISHACPPGLPEVSEGGRAVPRSDISSPPEVPA